MIILPAIDIKDGQCVRLYQGDYSQATTYSADPLEVARRWLEARACWLHIVDLDGAAAGHPVNDNLIARIASETQMLIQTGGGIRTLEQIEHLVNIGVKHVVLGTTALTDRELLTQALQRWDRQITVGLDARDGFVAIKGWQETSRVKAIDLALELSELGARRFVYTDIARDGTLRGPNFAALGELLTTLLRARTEVGVIASGGIRSLDDLQRLDRMGCEGAIIGKALYTGEIDLRTAIILIELGYKDLATYEAARHAFEHDKTDTLLTSRDGNVSEDVSSTEEQIARIEREVAEAARSANAC